MAERTKILLVRLDGVGDAALCVPALQGLSERYPDARFGAVCSPANANFFSQRVAHTHVFGSGATIAECAADIKAVGYTHALIATEEVAGYALGRASGARRRAGFWHGWQKPFKSLWQRAQLTNAIYRPAAWSDKPEHEVLTLYRLAQALGAQAPAPTDTNLLSRWLRIEDGTAGTSTRTAAFQVTPKLLTAGWGPAALAETIVGVQRSLGLERCELVAAAQDEGLAYAIMEQVPAAHRAEKRTIVCGGMSLPHWLGKLSQCTITITPDTGAAHAAGMLGVPVIDIFEADGFDRLSQQWRPWAATSRCLVKPRWHPAAAANFAARLVAAARELGV